LPLAHDRGVRAGDPVALAARDALADALGFGVYRAYGCSDAPVDWEVTDEAESRRRELVDHLEEALAAVRSGPRPADIPSRFTARVEALLRSLASAVERERFGAEAPPVRGVVASFCTTPTDDP